MNFEYITPNNKSGNIIKVVGVGGGGNNAVNNMFENGIYGVDFFICNTDHQALLKSPIPIKIQIGNNITSGLGCGADPNVGKLSAEESIDELKEMLKNNTKMVFVTAGMGGGTGTGAAPVIARLAKEMGILTVGIVTSPFRFEGDWRKKISEAGIQEMQDAVDTLLIINNENLFSLCPKNTKIKEAYRFADKVLYNAAKGIAEIITREGYINVDFADVQTIMKNGGTAIMGTATFSGENRAQLAVEEALASPLLDNVDLQGATGVLFNVSASEDSMTLDEVQIIGDYIKNAVGPQARIIYGQVYDDNLGDDLALTVIATGFGKKNQKIVKVEVPTEKEKDVPKVNTVQNLFVDSQEPEYKLYKSEVKTIATEEKKELRNLFDNVEQTKEPITKEVTKIEAIHVEESKTEPLSEEHQNVSEINQNSDTQTTINHRQDVLERKNMTRSDYQDPDKLRDLEKIPAYERYNLNVSIEPSKKISRMSIQGDEHGSKFRENNSFLDDLVD